MKACPSCGSRNEERSLFCNDCGQRLQAAAESAPGSPDPRKVTDAGEPGTVSMHGGKVPEIGGVPSAPTPVAPPRVPTTTGVCAGCGYRFPGGVAVSWCPGCGALLEGAPSTTTSNIPSASPLLPETANSPAAAAAPPPPGWALVLLKAGERLDRWQLRGPETVIGRSEGDIQFREDPLLSPRHAVVAYRPPSFWIEDAGSLNGVYVRLQEARRLRGGDLLNLGGLVVRYESWGEGPRSTALLSASGGVKPFGSGRERARGSLIRILQDGSDGPAYPLTPSRTIVGRKAGHLLFPDDLLLSRQHAQFYERDGEMWAEDLGSSNGTLLRIRDPAPLEKGTVVRIGDVTLEVAGP